MLHMGSRMKNVDNDKNKISMYYSCLESKTTTKVELNKQDLGHV